MKHLFEKLQRHVTIPAIDKIEFIQSDSHIVTIKSVSLTDPAFQGQLASFPQQNLIDAHYQSGILYLLNQNYLDDHDYQLSKISSFESLQDIFPGDQIRFETEIKTIKNNLFSFLSPIVTPSLIIQ